MIKEKELIRFGIIDYPDGNEIFYDYEQVEENKFIKTKYFNLKYVYSKEITKQEFCEAYEVEESEV